MNYKFYLLVFILLASINTNAQTTSDILVVAAGGSGGAHRNTGTAGSGGGGGGGVMHVTGTTLANGTYTITVAGTTNGKNTNGSCNGIGNVGANSIFRNAGSTLVLTTFGGGGGGGCNTGPGANGGSGGGGHAGTSAGGNVTNGTFVGLSGGTVTRYGNVGGTANGTTGAGGGGAGSAPGTSKNGGAGISLAITGTSQVYGSGGGGNAATGGIGGTNAGNGANGNANPGANINAANNFGGGGGGNDCENCTSGSGGSGVVIIRYASNARLATGGDTSSYTNAGIRYQVHRFTTSGFFVLNSIISNNPSTATQNVCINGSSTALSVTATGTSITYQWYSNTTATNSGGTLIPSATNSTYTPPTNVANTRYYYCFVTNSSGSTNSAVSGAININNPSVAGTISGANTVTAGINSTLLTLNSNTGSVQWQSSTNGTTFSNIGGATSGTYTATNIAVTTFYRAVVTNGGCASATSASVTILVIPSTTPVSTTLSITGTGSTLTIPNNTHTVVDNALVVTSNGNISGFAVAITENYSAGDVLGYTGTLPTGVTTSGFSTTSRSIVFKGSASAADWQTFLRTITLRSTSVTCNPEKRAVSFTVSTNFYNYFNGHYYEYVSAGKVWTDAKAHAESKTFFGRQGYLTTINSAEENAYVNKLIGQNSWMGGSDNFKMINQAVGYIKYANQSQAEGKFHWVTGPEKGTQLTNSNGNVGWRTDVYNRWANGEANNYNTGFYDVITATYGEHYLHAYSASSTWNDFPNDRRLGSIIEYGDMPGDNPVNSIAFTRNLTIMGMTGGGITGGGGTVCSGSNSTNLTLSGATGTVARWEFSDDNFLTNVNIINNTTSNYTAVNITSTTYYRAVMINGSCTLATPSTVLRVNVTNAGSISAMTNQVCVGSNSTLFLSGAVGTVNKWQITTNPETTISDISSVNTTLSHTMSSAGNFLLRAIVSNGGCSVSDTSEWYPIDVSGGGAPNGGIVTSAAHCGSANSGVLSLSDATGSSFVWESSINNGSTWSNAGSTSSSFTYYNISKNTLYRVLVSNGSCGSSYSSVGEIVIYGTTICEWTGAGANNLWNNTDNWCAGIIATDGRIVEINSYSPSDPALTTNLHLGKLDFNSSSRKVILGNYNLEVETVLGNDSMSFVQTNGSGLLKKQINNNDSFTFAIGNSAYNPVKITNKTGATDSFSARVYDQVFFNGFFGMASNRDRIDRTWDIFKKNPNGGSGIDFQFNWNYGESVNLSSGHRLNHFENGEWAAHTAGVTTVNENSLSYKGYLGTFSPFGIGGGLTMLPIKLIQFNVIAINHQAQLNWTAQAENKHDFEIYKSHDGINYTKIATIEGIQNNATQNYQYTDLHPLPFTYYKITIKENNTIQNQSLIKTLNLNKISNHVKIYPNPNTGSFDIETQSNSTYIIQGISGKIIKQGDVNGKVTINDLAKGIYIVSIQSNENFDVVKIIIQ